MPFTYQEILEEVLPVYHQNPERFMRFYHAVNNILAAIPEGSSIRIDEHCKPASRDLFIKIAAMYIIEETTRKDVLDDFLEFSDDYSAIRHVPKVVLAVNWHHFYSNRR
jgi:hypothetical protein